MRDRAITVALEVSLRDGLAVFHTLVVLGVLVSPAVLIASAVPGVLSTPNALAVSLPGSFAMPHALVVLGVPLVLAALSAVRGSPRSRGVCPVYLASV